MKSSFNLTLLFCLAGSLTAQNFTSNLKIENGSPQIHFKDVTAGHDDYWIHVNNGRLYFLWDEGDDGDWDSPRPLFFQGRNAYFAGDALMVITPLMQKVTSCGVFGMWVLEA